MNLKLNRNKKIAIFIIVIFILAIITYNNMNNSKNVKLETTYGDIIIELYDDMPTTTGNF